MSRTSRSGKIALAALAAILAGPALAQTTVTGSPAGGDTSAQSGNQQAVTRPNTDKADPGNPAATGAVTNARLEAGANSFTEGEVRSRLEHAGFSGVGGLRKDDQGIWRGTATQNGRQVSVGLDFKGNVATQ